MAQVTLGLPAPRAVGATFVNWGHNVAPFPNLGDVSALSEAATATLHALNMLFFRDARELPGPARWRWSSNDGCMGGVAPRDHAARTDPS